MEGNHIRLSNLALIFKSVINAQLRQTYRKHVLAMLPLHSSDGSPSADSSINFCCSVSSLRNTIASLSSVNFILFPFQVKLFNVQKLSMDTYSTFELRCVKIASDAAPLICALIYRAPKHDKDFITEFCDFLSHSMTLYNHLLILGDSNIYVCCPGKPMASEFRHVLDSF